MNKKNTLATLLIGAVAALHGCASTRAEYLEERAQAIANTEILPVEFEFNGIKYSKITGVVVIANRNKTTEELLATEQPYLQIVMRKENDDDNFITEMHDYGIDGTCDAGTYYGNTGNLQFSYSNLSETGMENKEFFQREYEKALNDMLLYGPVSPAGEQR